MTSVDAASLILMEAPVMLVAWLGGGGSRLALAADTSRHGRGPVWDCTDPGE